jgi:hypothetical protein
MCHLRLAASRRELMGELARGECLLPGTRAPERPGGLARPHREAQDRERRDAGEDGRRVRVGGGVRDGEADAKERLCNGI